MHSPVKKGLGFAYKKEKSAAEQNYFEKATKEQNHVDTVKYDFTF
jgi:hypothetical protein